MAILLCPNAELLDEIACTPNLENGIGPVLLGSPVQLEDGRLAVVHPWSEVDVDWLSAYAQAVKGAEVLEGDVIPYPLKRFGG